MSDPKLLTIIKAIETRLLAIDGSGLFHTDIGATVVRGKRNFQSDELPACCCYLLPRTFDEAPGHADRLKVDSTIVIEAHGATGAHPEDTAISMLADIQRAIELEDDTLGGLVVGKLQYQGDAISYPEDLGKHVSVQVLYSVPHVRFYGDPDQ